MSHPNTPSCNRRRDEVVVAWLKYRDAFLKRGIPFKPVSGLPPAIMLPQEIISQALVHLTAYGEFVVLNQSVDLWDDREFAETYLRHIRIRPPQEFLSTVESDDLVEMYDMNNIQIFRNMNFMKICGYSLADLAVHPWPVLFERSQLVTTRIQSQIGRSVLDRTLVKLDVPPHFMKERFSSTRQVVEVRLRHSAPIYDLNNVPSGFAVSCKAKIVEEVPKGHELRFI